VKTRYVWMTQTNGRGFADVLAKSFPALRYSDARSPVTAFLSAAWKSPTNKDQTSFAMPSRKSCASRKSALPGLVMTPSDGQKRIRTGFLLHGSEFGLTSRLRRRGDHPQDADERCRWEMPVRTA
jgi:hypothetical protein